MTYIRPESISDGSNASGNNITSKKRKLLQIVSKEGEPTLIDLKPLPASFGTWQSSFLDSDKEYGSAEKRLSLIRDIPSEEGSLTDGESYA